jgi:hypothetical protein
MSDKPLADQAQPAFTTAADNHPAFIEAAKQPPPVPGQSVSPGLRTVPNSFGRPTADGAPVAHVFGPGQAAVDPVAAGLDPNYSPLTRAENRMITRTDTGESEPARPDHEAAMQPGPTGSLEGRPTVIPSVVPSKVAEQSPETIVASESKAPAPAPKPAVDVKPLP